MLPHEVPELLGLDFWLRIHLLLRLREPDEDIFSSSFDDLFLDQYGLHLVVYKLLNFDGSSSLLIAYVVQACPKVGVDEFLGP